MSVSESLTLFPESKHHCMNQDTNKCASDIIFLLQQMPKKVENAKIALLDYNLKKYRLAFGVQVTTYIQLRLLISSFEKLCALLMVCRVSPLENAEPV